MRVPEALLPSRRAQRLGMRTLQAWREEGTAGIARQLRRGLYRSYDAWVREYDTLRADDRRAILKRIGEFAYRPQISVVMPVYDVDERWLRGALESVAGQLYPGWELCVADDCSPSPHVREVLGEYARRDARVKVTFRERNGHISEASNSALALASGEYVALLDHDDLLPPHALYMVVEELNAHPEADLLFSDEDKIDGRGRRFEPFFKPDWNPDLFYSLNCVSHLGVYRRSAVEAVGGFRAGYEGSQDYDLALRVAGRAPESHIRHIPHVLYHWRAIPGSVSLGPGEKDYAHEAARRAIKSHLVERGVAARVTAGFDFCHRVVYDLASRPLVSLIVHAGGEGHRAEEIGEILDKTEYRPVELVILRGPGTGHDTAIDGWAAAAQIIEHDGGNLSAARNEAARRARGEVIAFVGEGVRVVSTVWLEELVSHAVRPEVGAVGAKIEGADGLSQCAGFVLGAGGVAARAHLYPPQLDGAYWALPHVIQACAAVSADCLVMRRRVFEDVGGFDEVNLPTVYADVDLCVRLRVRGLRVVWTPYAELAYRRGFGPAGPGAAAPSPPGTVDPARYMKNKWGRALREDPFYSPNLDLEYGDFALSFPPRLPMPWRAGGRWA